jgi:hypothetical protein
MVVKARHAELWASSHLLRSIALRCRQDLAGCLVACLGGSNHRKGQDERFSAESGVCYPRPWQMRTQIVRSRIPSLLRPLRLPTQWKMV